jgi:glycine/D-amino acid oxidase-like deaminating enzyme
MKRRRFLKSVAAATFAARAYPAAAAVHVVVIGAGILGASIAYHLARRGVRVTILEKTRPASGATGESFAYLNASTKSPRPYYELNWLGISGWRRLQLELGGALPLQLGGSVYWCSEPEAAAKLQSTLRGYQEWGYAGHRIDAEELHRILPNATPGRIDAAVFYEEEGTVDPSGAVDVLLARAMALGATLKYPVEVVGLDIGGDRVRGVDTAGGKIAADTVVIAAGVGSPALAELAGSKLPLTPSPGVLAHTAPLQPLVGSVVFAPDSTLKQNPDGRIVISGGFEGSPLTANPQDQGEQILKNAARYFPRLRGVSVDRVTVGHRVLPADGFPIVGFLGNARNIYVAVMHSGVTLAPIIGQLATEEVLDGVGVEPLAPYRPARFAG